MATPGSIFRPSFYNKWLELQPSFCKNTPFLKIWGKNVHDEL